MRRASFKIPDWPRDRPTVDQVLPLVRALYATDHGGAGGCLHIVLDDGNLSDHDIEYCLGTDYCCDQCRTIGEMMLKMTGTQRRKVYRGDRRPASAYAGDFTWRVGSEHQIAKANNPIDLAAGRFTIPIFGWRIVRT